VREFLRLIGVQINWHHHTGEPASQSRLSCLT
jgi:hypothetical protein